MKRRIKELLENLNLMPVKKVHILGTGICIWHYKNGNMKTKK